MAEAKTTLRVQITADLADIKQGLGLLRGELAKVKQQAAASTGGGMLGSLSNELKGLLGGLGLAAITFKTIALGKAALDTADQIGKLSQKTGASVETLSVLRVAVHGSREEFDLIAASLPKLAKAQYEAASGNDKMTRAFARLGIPMADVKRLDPGELFVEIAQKLGGMQNGSEKAAIAMALFGKTGAELIPIMHGLADDGFEQTRQRAEALGLVLTQDMVNAADAAGDAVGDMQLIAEGAATSFLSKFAPAVTSAMVDINNAVTTDGLGAMEILGQAASGVIQTVVSIFAGVTIMVSAAIDRVRIGIDGLRDIAGKVSDGDFGGAKDRFLQTLAQQRNIDTAGRAALQAELDKVLAAFAGNVRAPKGSARATGGGTEGDPDEDKDKKKIVAGAVDLAEMAIDAIERQLKALDLALEDGLVGLTDYYSRKQSLEEAAIDAEIAKAEADAKSATSSEAQSRALTKIQQLQLDRAEIGPRIAREQAEAEKKLAAEIQGVADQMAALEGRSDEAVRGQLERQFAKLRKQLQAEGDLANQVLLDRFINTKAFEAKLGDLQGKVSEAMQRLQTAEGSIASQVDAGLLPQSTAEQQLQDIRQRTIDQLREQRERTIAWLATMSPDDPNAAKALQFLQEIDGQIAQVDASQHQFRGQVIDQATDSLTNFFNNLATGAMTAKQAVRELVLSFIQGLARMAAEALAKRIILSFLNGFGGGGGGGAPTGFLGAFGAGGYHTGGIVGSGGLTRLIPPILLGHAPRYHGGGIAGLAPDEQAAVLRKDEEVLTRQDARHRWNGGGRERTRVKTPIVAIGERAIADALAGAAGEDIVLTHVRNNWGGLTGGGG